MSVPLSSPFYHALTIDLHGRITLRYRHVEDGWLDHTFESLDAFRSMAGFVRFKTGHDLFDVDIALGADAYGGHAPIEGQSIYAEWEAECCEDDTQTLNHFGQTLVGPAPNSDARHVVDDYLRRLPPATQQYLCNVCGYDF